MKYNYLKAANIWDRLINITFDMPDYFDTENRQKERRYFLKALTRNDKGYIDIILDYITNYIIDFGTDSEKKDLEKIALQIVFFTNENNY